MIPIPNHITDNNDITDLACLYNNALQALVRHHMEFGGGGGVSPAPLNNTGGLWVIQAPC